MWKISEIVKWLYGHPVYFSYSELAREKDILTWMPAITKHVRKQPVISENETSIRAIVITIDSLRNRLLMAIGAWTRYKSLIKRGGYVGADLSGLRGTRTNERPVRVCTGPCQRKYWTRYWTAAGVMLGSPQASEQQMKLGVVYIGTVYTQPPETSCHETFAQYTCTPVRKS